jgi:hypothetical protein
MSDAYLVPCLVVLRAGFNRLNPNRDKGSDGWIGDAAHQAETSDHNPDSQGRVLALDIDSSGPWPVPFGDLVESMRGDSRLEYVIWNRRIASRSQGWTWRAYSGTSDPHTGHAHFSARHDHAGNNSTAAWPLEDIVTPQDIKDLVAAVMAAPVKVGDDTWRLDTAVGYAAREVYLVDKALPATVSIPTADEIAEAVAARLGVVTPPPAPGA